MPDHYDDLGEAGPSLGMSRTQRRRFARTGRDPIARLKKARTKKRRPQGEAGTNLGMSRAQRRRFARTGRDPLARADITPLSVLRERAGQADLDRFMQSREGRRIDALAAVDPSTPVNLMLGLQRFESSREGQEIDALAAVDPSMSLNRLLEARRLRVGGM